MLKRTKNREVTMRDRFISRVLFPPFLILVIIGGVGFWQLNNYLTNESIDEIQTAARASAIRLEREIAIRETVLKNTAEEISSIKNNYIADLAELENKRATCRDYYLQKYTFNNSPEGACDIFSQGSRASLAIIEDVYIDNAKNLQGTEINDINRRLAAFKQFFPETVVIIVFGENSEVISSAVSGDSNLSVDDFKDITINSSNESVQGKIVKKGNSKLAVFAFPTLEGSVLAAYDVNNSNFIYPSWDSTPINRDDASVVVVESSKNVVYPGVRNELELISSTQNLTSSDRTNAKLGGVDNILVAEQVGDSDWKILVASPEAIVYEQIRDTQIIIVFITGIFIVGFLWVGYFFIKKTTDNLAQLVTGAMVYGSGRLDYKLDLSNSEKEFKQLADTMNYMASRIAQNEQEIDEKNKEFISIATHELRAPMTSIIGYLSMLKENTESKLTKQNAMLLETAYDGTTRLRDLVNDMLDAARLEGGREDFVIQKLSISKYINDCVQSMKIVADQNNIELNYNDKHTSDVFADEAKLRIILNNFVSNAIKYNHKGGKVKITHSVKDDQLITAISNTGPTIPLDQQEHMYEKFFRVDTAEHKKVTGTGIGMYVTKQYIVAMNGKTWFSSSPGQSTVFYFSLPINGGNTSDVGHKIKSSKNNNSKWIMRWRRRLR